MNTLVVTISGACFVSSAVLLVLAWRRRGIVPELVRAARFAGVGIPFVSKRVRYGVIEPSVEVITAPFTERAVLFVRATLSGRRPDGRATDVLWQRTRVVGAKLTSPQGDVPLAIDKLVVLAPRDFRHAMLRALLPEIPKLPTYLARVGYTSPPSSSQWFHLEEEVIRPGEKAIVLFSRAGEPVMISTLPPWKVAFRLAWGPALVAIFALIVAGTGVATLLTWWWIR